MPGNRKQAYGFPTAAFLHQVRQAPAASAAQQHDALGVRRQVLGVEPRLTAVDGAGQGEQAREVGVAPSRLGEQRQTRAVLQGSSPPVMGWMSRNWPAGEFEGAAQVGVGQGQGVAAVRFWPASAIRGRAKRRDRTSKKLLACSSTYAAPIGAPYSALPVPAAVPVVAKHRQLPAVAGIHAVVGSRQRFRQPPQVERPAIIDAVHRAPLPPQVNRQRLSVRAFAYRHRDRQRQGLDGVLARGSMGICRARRPAPDCQGATVTTRYSA